MRELNINKIKETIKPLLADIAFVYSKDIRKALEDGKAQEENERSVLAMEMLLNNAEIAENERIPICQDTGMVTFFVKAGQDVHFIGGSLNSALNEAAAETYTENYLRASVVDDPLFDRVNTKNNTPAVIYTELVEGDQVEIRMTAKGFGSENMSRIAMLKPAEGVEGVKRFVLETIELAGPNACPPMIVGVGIGGTFDSCAMMAKKALLRPLDEGNPDSRYKALEDELLESANQLMIGPMGLHGKTTALKVQIEQMPTHIAGMPCAVNICCHACRHAEMTL